MVHVSHQAGQMDSAWFNLRPHGNSDPVPRADVVGVPQRAHLGKGDLPSPAGGREGGM